MQRGDGEPAVALPLAVVGHRERRRRPGRGLFGLEAAGFLGLGGLGVDHLEQPAAQDPQRPGVVVGGLAEQERLRLRHHTGVEIIGQVVDRVDDHARLLDVDRTRQPTPHRRAGWASSSRARQPRSTVRGRSRGPGLVGQPVRRRRRPHRTADVDPVRVREQPQLELGRPASPAR